MSMAMSEIIKQMEELAGHCESMIDKKDPESIWRKDVEALKEAIIKLECKQVGNNGADIIRELMDKEELNQQQLADRMGAKRQSVNQMLCRNSVSMRLDSFVRLIEALGYEVVVRKK
mgnify:CR=1 FL=1